MSTTYSQVFKFITALECRGRIEMSRKHILSVQHKNAKVKVAKLFHQQDSLRKLLLDGTTGICLHWAPCTVPDYVENSKTFRS